MKYKQWANEESWLPEGSGLQILTKVPEGVPSLVRPDTRKIMEVDALIDCVKKCKRLTTAERKWWTEFTDKERIYREKWSSASEDYFGNAKKHKWYLNKLRPHKPLKQLQRDDVDQQEREQNLENLLDKANRCPEVCNSITAVSYNIPEGPCSVILNHSDAVFDTCKSRKINMINYLDSINIISIIDENNALHESVTQYKTQKL